MTINEAQDQVIEEFSDFDDWMDKYQLLIDLGNEQQPLDEKYKTDKIKLICFGLIFLNSFIYEFNSSVDKPSTSIPFTM